MLASPDAGRGGAHLRRPDRGPHGMRGEVKLKSFTADPEAVKDYGPLTREDGTASFEMRRCGRPRRTWSRGFAASMIATLPSAHQSQAVRAARPPAAAGRRRVLSRRPDRSFRRHRRRAAVGKVVAIHDFGAGDILEMRPPAGGATIMLPFADAFVPESILRAGASSWCCRRRGRIEAQEQPMSCG